MEYVLLGENLSRNACGVDDMWLLHIFWLGAGNGRAHAEHLWSPSLIPDLQVTENKHSAKLTNKSTSWRSLYVEVILFASC